MILPAAEDYHDPWIEAEIGAYATEIRRGLPKNDPPPTSAAFIAADIKITFPLLTDLLWTP